MLRRTEMIFFQRIDRHAPDFTLILRQFRRRFRPRSQENFLRSEEELLVNQKRPLMRLSA
jgi:hypothetical protein